MRAGEQRASCINGHPDRLWSEDLPSHCASSIQIFPEAVTCAHPIPNFVLLLPGELEKEERQEHPTCRR